MMPKFGEERKVEMGRYIYNITDESRERQEGISTYNVNVCKMTGCNLCASDLCSARNCLSRTSFPTLQLLLNSFKDSFLKVSRVDYIPHVALVVGLLAPLVSRVFLRSNGYARKAYRV